MRNMLALFAAGILTVVGLGWYLGWYKVRSQPASVPGQHSVQIDINTKQISKDIKQGEQKIQQMIDTKTKDEVTNAKKTGDSLMLPSPPPKGASFQIGGDTGATIQFGGKGPMVQFGGKKPNTP